MEPGLANTLANALSKDDQGGGTSAGAAQSVGWSYPVSGKTGTTESHRPSGFLGFTNSLAGAAYVYGDSPTPGEVCSFPLRSCGDGDLFGGNEPARTWYNAIRPVVGNFPAPELPPIDQKYARGSSDAQVPDVAGMTQGAATAELTAAGFQVNPVTTSGTAVRGTVLSVTPSGSAVPGWRPAASWPWPSRRQRRLPP